MDVVSDVALGLKLNSDHIAFQACRNVMVRLNQTFPAIDKIIHTSTQTGFAQLDTDFSCLKRDASGNRFRIAPAVDILTAPVDNLMAQFGKLEHEPGGTGAGLLFGLLVVVATEGGKH